MAGQLAGGRQGDPDDQRRAQRRGLEPAERARRRRLIRADRADEIARRSGSDYGGQWYGCSSAHTTTLDTQWFTAGRKVRAVVAWDADTADANYTTRPSADLDLTVRGPGGTSVASSWSWDNTYEIVEFTPTVTGTYSLTNLKFRCDRGTYLGWSWRQGT